MQVPPNSLVVGTPGKIVKKEIDRESFIRSLAAKYVRLATNHVKG